MHQIQQSALLSILITLLSWGCSLAEHQHTCPIGYTKAYKKYKGDDPVCYRLKGPEKFADKFQGCAGNLYTTKLYYSLNITETNVVLWTDYKTMYRGGPFIDWSYTDSMGDLLPSSNEVNYDPNLSDEEACIIIDPKSNFTATKCDKKHYRFCIVRSFSKKNDKVYEGCEDSEGFWRYYSPRPTCLAPFRTVMMTTLKAYWAQAKDECSTRQASLLNEGWIYASDPRLSTSGKLFLGLPTFLLGIVLSPGNGTSWLDSARGDVWIPTSDWNFNDTNLTTKSTANVALIGNFWYLVNKTSLFSNIVICERPVQLRRVMINLTIHSEKNLVLSTNDTVNENDIKCFTDSKNYTPVCFRVKYVDSTENFIYFPENDGYYWCVLTNSRKYYVTESNKVLFIRDKKSLVNYYAVKISFKHLHRLDGIKNWENKLEEYMFYRTKYVKEFGELPMDNQASEQILKEFKASHPLLRYKKGDLIRNITIKRYIQWKEALLQVELKPEMMPIPRWTWGNIEVIYMKPVYYCKELDSIPMLPLGTSITSSGCSYSCEGDFNEGVQWVKTGASGCTTTTSEIPIKSKLQQVLDGLEKLLQDDTVTDAGIQKSFDQLQQVLDGLENLLQDDTVTDAGIQKCFDQVNELLQTQEDIKIPGSMLSYLDELSTRIDLNGSSNLSVIRSDIALLMADAGPTTPVKGIRIAARDADKFNDNDFEFICDYLDPKRMTANESEAVVYLPDSVANSSTRISFVVFRNDKAFYKNRHYLVNSLILSVTVENLSQFDDGQTVDLHLSPINQDLDHSVNPSCVYWYIREDGTGYWSTEGCTFTKSTGEGVLDICRCTHLTHFAEVIIQTCAFSDRHEDILEVLTIIGCCLSVFGICMVGVTAAVFRPWRRDYTNKIWLQLCIAILLLVVSFLIRIFLKFDHDSTPCVLVGVALHYSVLASFCWMLVAAVLSYRRLVIVFSIDASHKLLRASAFSWGAPSAVVGVLLSVDPRAYAGQFGENAPSGDFCYPSSLGLWLAVYAPIAIILLVNWTLFALIRRSVFNPRTIRRQGDTKEAVRCVSVSCLLVFLFGLPWVFGLFACNIVAAYLFTLTATYQGFVLFIFFVLGNKKTRDLWLKKLQRKQMKIPVMSWKYTHRRPGLHRLVGFWDISTSSSNL